MDARNDQQPQIVPDEELENVAGGVLPEMHSSALESIAGPMFQRGMSKDAVYAELVKRGVIKAQQDYWISDKRINLLHYLADLRVCYDSSANQEFYYDY